MNGKQLDGKVRIFLLSNFNIFFFRFMKLLYLMSIFHNWNKISFQYNGYSSCPFLVSRRSVVFAEFTPEGPYETFPFNQAKPMYISYLMKRHILPFIYWNFGLNGHWLGPAKVRKLLHLGLVQSIIRAVQDIYIQVCNNLQQWRS